MPLYDQTTLPYGVDDVRTVNNATKNQDTDQALTREGLGAKAHAKLGSEWKTTITWDPIDGDSKDGTGVEASVLGPDHLAGEAPDSNYRICPNVSTLNDIAGLESNKGYVKGHLLNEKLGGPGNDNRNLTAIPRSTNTGGMKDHVEERLKTLVNERRAWVYFKAKVSHTDVPKKKGVQKHRYAHKLKFWWHELKDDGTGKPAKAPGTEGTAVLDVPPPAEYYDTDYSQETTTKTYGVKKTGKQDSTTDKDTAIADLPWNAIILQDWDTAKKRSEMIKIAAVEIERLGAEDAKRMVDYLTEAHGKTEVELFQWIEAEAKRLETDPLAQPSDELGDKLRAYDKERGGRIDVVTKEVEDFLGKKLVPTASTLAQKFKDELGKHDPLASHRKLILQLLERNKQVSKEKEEAQDLALDYSYGFETPGSPWTDHAESEKLDPTQTSTEQSMDTEWLEREKTGVVQPPAKIDMPVRRKRLRTEKQKVKQHKSFKETVVAKPTHMARQCMWMLDKMRETKSEPKELVAVKFVDEHAYKLLHAYIAGDNDLVTRDTVWPWLRGIELDRPEAFVRIAKFLRQMAPELAKQAGEQVF